MQQFLHPSNLRLWHEHMNRKHSRVLHLLQSSMLLHPQGQSSFATPLPLCWTRCLDRDPTVSRMISDRLSVASYFIVALLGLLTGATLGRPLIAPADPTEMDGSKKSIKPSIARKGVDDDRGKSFWNSRLETWATIRVNLPTLAHLSDYVSENNL